MNILCRICLAKDMSSVINIEVEEFLDDFSNNNTSLIVVSLGWVFQAEVCLSISPQVGKIEYGSHSLSGDCLSDERDIHINEVCNDVEEHSQVAEPII